MSWPRVIGQERVKRFLLQSIAGGRMPHAYLFHGPEGTGKDAMAIELARVLHCEQGGEEACDRCGSCVRFRTLQHPDVHFVTALPRGKGEDEECEPLEKLDASVVRAIQEEIAEKAKNPYRVLDIPRANVIKINSIREIRRLAPMAAAHRGGKTFIISRADMMGDEAANALLKTLEEPPRETLLILTTARPDDLPRTAVSRCQAVRFDPLGEEEILAALRARTPEEGEATDEESVVLAARLANGSYTRAQELLQEDIRGIRAQAVEFLRRSVVGEAAAVWRIVEDLAAGRDRPRVARFLTFLLVWLRDALVLRYGGTVMNVDDRAALERFRDNLPRADLPRAIAAAESALSLVDRNVYIPLVLLQLAIRLRRALLDDRTGS